MQFQLCSDLHLEMWAPDQVPAATIVPCAPYLILAGDIGSSAHANFRQWIAYCASHWTHVFFVCGNHEFYRSRSMTYVLNELHALFATYSNVHLLNNSFVELPNSVAIYGFTGWTPVPPMSRPKTLVNDFARIHTVHGPWTTARQNQASRQDLDQFRAFLNQCSCQHLVVVTHFPPIRDGTTGTHSSHSTATHDHDASDWIREYYTWQSMLDRELGDMARETEKIRLWCSGHTHASYDFVRGHTRFVSNPLGYPGDQNAAFRNTALELHLALDAHDV